MVLNSPVGWVHTVMDAQLVLGPYGLPSLLKLGGLTVQGKVMDGTRRWMDECRRLGTRGGQRLPSSY